MRNPPRKLRTKLATGAPVLGVTVQLPSPDAVEIAGYAGLDFVWIDAEHGTMDLGDINHLVRAADAAGVDAIVRVPDHSPSFIQRVLDAGAAGIMAPHVRTLEDARAVVAATRLAPDGVRGACPSIRAVGHLTTDWAADLKRAREDVFAFGLVEDIEGVENVEVIARESGLDGLLFGPFDLSMALGHDGDIANATVREMGARVRKAAISAGIEYIAIPGWDHGTIESLAGEGIRIFNLSGDRGALFMAFREAREKAERAFEGSRA